MGLSVGIVGLPNVGKSTLFNALLKKQQAYVANFPFATIEPNVGIVPVPDTRLEKLAKAVATSREPKLTREESLPPIVPATCEFLDIAGLIKGASKGEGLGNKFLSHIREVDAICHVVRAFSDPDIIKQGVTDPKTDFEVVKLELDLADLDHPDAPPLAKKPILVALNIDEKDLSKSKEIEIEFAKQNGLKPEQVVAVCAKTESELSELSSDEQKAYLADLGIKESALDRLIKKAFATLGLNTFLTAGEKEVRAWTIKNGINAQSAAGVIHTDFIKKFIKADVCDFEKFVEAPGWKNARDKGYVRSEGRDYIMKDGDVVEFKIGS
ncbi:MAG: GTP-binding protein YchF [Candidatus Levybacteria bacterium GW2011_GWC1_40_19]|nr:MAG: GTP-binding protein YchF [Candidatus Levybacteria bacterium GW2011_GWC1_40_19]